MQRNKWVVIAVTVALALSLCACGADGKGEETTTTTVPTTTTTTGTPTTFEAASDSALKLSSPNGKRPSAETLERLASVIKAHRGSLSVYYKDLETGYTLTYDAGRNYQAASVIKAPYVKWLLTQDVDGTEQLTLKEKKGGSSYIDEKPIGTTFSVNDLMGYAIRYSDNSAYNMLNARFGFADFNKYAENLGVTANRDNNCVLVNPRPQFGYLSAQDIGLYFEDIAKFVETGTPEAKKLFSWLVTTTEQAQLPDAYTGRKQYMMEKTSDGVSVEGAGDGNVTFLTTEEAVEQAYATRKQGYTIGHKYGEQGDQAYHDGAIVWRDHPYVLAITSTLVPYDQGSLDVFHNIAMLVDQLQTDWYN